MIFTSNNGVKPLWFAALILLVVGTVSAQTPGSDGGASGTPTFTEEDRDVFAPFVSRLRVAVRDPQVRLTWRDSDDLESGSYRVYRHTAEITQDTIDNAALVAEVDTGVETYLDTPLEEGAYYYAVIAAEESGRMFPIFVPFRNKTIRPVTVAQLETEEDLAPACTVSKRWPRITPLLSVLRRPGAVATSWYTVAQLPLPITTRYRTPP